MSFDINNIILHAKKEAATVIIVGATKTSLFSLYLERGISEPINLKATPIRPSGARAVLLAPRPGEDHTEEKEEAQRQESPQEQAS